MAHTIITDPFLQSVLDTSTQTRQQCMDLIDFSSANAVSTSSYYYDDNNNHNNNHSNINNFNNTQPPPSQPSLPPLSSAELQRDLTKQQRTLYARLGELRSLNRNAILQVRETKQMTAEARQEIDRLHLHLQNLYYEERHLRGEIAACESYDHRYQQLPLIPIETFLHHRPDLATADEKTLMFARISHELSEREALEQARQGLLKKKQGLIADNKKRKEDLASLDKDLETFIDAAKPIQKIFEKQY